MSLSNRVLRIAEVSHKTGKGQSTIYRDIKEGNFPSPISLGARASGWLESEIDAWIEERIAASRGETESAAKKDRYK